jgi:RimJ/RimL family protein N-acetyltransferase
MAEYPSQYESGLLLNDGSRIRLRPIRRNDTEAWLAFVNGLSTHSKYLRFHHVIKNMGMEDAQRFCSVDYKDSFALIAETFWKGHRDIIAIGRYNRLNVGNNAEFAVVVEDAFQRKGIGTKIMDSLVKAAHDNGITTFEGDILTENYVMMAVLKDCGFKVTTELETGVFHVTFPTARV